MRIKNGNRPRQIALDRSPLRLLPDGDRESRIHRRGVYALERIPPRRKVIEYTGERISRRETKRRGDGPITYLFTLDGYWTLDGAVGGSGAEIINHSCDPKSAA